MDLLVTAGTWLFRVDANTHEVSVVSGGTVGHYGLSWTLDGRHLCLAHDRSDRARPRTMADYTDSEVGGITLGDKGRFNCLSAPHQLLCTPKHVVATNTGRNCITVFRQDDLSYFNHWFDEVMWDRKGDDRICGSHFNSVYLSGDRLFVLAHNFSNNPDRCPYILELDWPGLGFVRRIEAPSKEPHNIWPLASGEMIMCDSLDGSLVEVTSGRTLWRAETANVITRGLACHGKTVFVGESILSSNRRCRQLGDGRVCVLDRDTWKQVDRINLPRAGQVCEVRILDAEDECHHGRPFAGALEPDAAVEDAYQERIAAFRETTNGDFRVRQADWIVAAGLVSVTPDEHIWPEGGLQTVALRKGISAANVRISVNVAFSDLQETEYAGLVARYAGPGNTNMYVAQLYRDRDNFRAHVWRNEAGQWELLGHSSLDRPRGRLQLEVTGTLLVLSMDAVPLVRVHDDRLRAPGQVGLRGLGGILDHFEVEVLT